MTPRAAINSIQSIYGFAGALISVFIPVYLLHQQVSLRGVMVYFLLYSIVVFAGTMIAGLFSRQCNLKWVMVLGFVPQIIFLWLLAREVAVDSEMLMLLASLQGMAAALYWLPLHIFFATATTSEEVGGQVGAFLAWPKFLTLFAPLLAGVLAAHAGVEMVFAVAIGFFVLSAIPLIFVPAYHAPLSFRPRKFGRYFQNYRGYFIAEIFENIGEELDMIIWPLAVYLLFDNVLSLGLAGTLLGVGGALFTYLLGKKTNRGNMQRLLQFGAILMIFLWLARFWTESVWMVMAVTVIVGIAELLVRLPFNALIYDLARESNTREFILFREIPVVIARIIVYGAGVLFAIQDVRHLFWLAIVGYAFFLLTPRLNLGHRTT